MQTNLLRYFSILAISVFFLACGSDSSEPTVALSGISINKTAEAVVGVDKNLTVKFTPENATNQKITWTTSNASVATVENGNVLAAKEGTATITATSDDGGFTATCAVTAVSRCDAINSTNNEHCKNKGTIAGKDGKLYCSTHKTQAEAE